MRQLIIDFIDAIIPLGFSMLILIFPQWFTKKNLMEEENKCIASKLNKIGWILMAAGILILIANIGSTLTKK